MSPATLSQLISGKRPLSPKQALRVAKGLDLSPQETLELIASTGMGMQAAPWVSAQYRTLPEAEFKVIATWQHYAVLSLGAVRQNQASAAWIGARLGITSDEASSILDQLVKAGLIEVRDGRFRQTDHPLATTLDVSSDAIRAYHRQILSLALVKLDQVPVECRDYSTMTFAIDPAKMKRAKRLLLKFRREFVAEMETSARKSDVYALALQLFPLSALKERPWR